MDVVLKLPGKWKEKAEKVFSPENVEVFRDVVGTTEKMQLGKQPPKRVRFQTRLVLSDKRGHKLEVKGRRLVHRVMMYLQPWTSFGSLASTRFRKLIKLASLVVSEKLYRDVTFPAEHFCLRFCVTPKYIATLIRLKIPRRH